MTPAELTRASNPPKRVWQAATVCWTDVGEVTSSTRASTRSLCNSSAVARSFSPSISAMATWAPWASRALAVLRPKPLAPPVISARLGFKVIFLDDVFVDFDAETGFVADGEIARFLHPRVGDEFVLHWGRMRFEVEGDPVSRVGH